MKIKKGKWQKLQERGQKSEGKEVEQIEVKLTLTTLKPIHAKWLPGFYNHMTTPEGEQVISSGWSAAGVTNALKNGETCLEPLDPFADIDPLVSEPSVEQDDSTIPSTRSGSWKWKCFWCYSSGVVICNFYWFSTGLFPKYTSLNLKSDSQLSKKILFASTIVLQKWWKMLFISS